MIGLFSQGCPEGRLSGDRQFWCLAIISVVFDIFELISVRGGVRTRGPRLPKEPTSVQIPLDYYTAPHLETVPVCSLANARNILNGDERTRQRDRILVRSTDTLLILVASVHTWIARRSSSRRIWSNVIPTEPILKSPSFGRCSLESRCR